MLLSLLILTQSTWNALLPMRSPDVKFLLILQMSYHGVLSLTSPDKTALSLSHHPYSVLFFLITHHLLHSSLFSACIQPQNSKKMVRYVFGCSVIFVEIMEFNPSDAIQTDLFFKRPKQGFFLLGKDHSLSYIICVDIYCNPTMLKTLWFTNFLSLQHLMNIHELNLNVNRNLQTIKAFSNLQKQIYLQDGTTNVIKK